MPNTTLDDFIGAGIEATHLIVNPKSWINRRVETIDLLSHEETRRRVSVDFTLDGTQIDELKTPHGVVVPVTALAKKRRRNFDLRDESGAAVPVLGKRENGLLANVAVMNAVLDVIPQVSDPVFELLSADVRQIVATDPETSENALSFFAGSAESGDPWRAPIWNDPVCRDLLILLESSYVLWAVLRSDSANRRILKFSYGDDDEDQFQDIGDLASYDGLSERLSDLVSRAWRPGRRRFLIETPMAYRAASFHVEVEVPEELRVEAAFLADFEANEPFSDLEQNVNRASLYAMREISDQDDVVAYVELTPERGGRLEQAAATCLLVCGLLWLGVISGLDAENPGASVSILLGGAALVSGVSAVRGHHALVRRFFAGSGRALSLVTLAALTASATLAMQIPSPKPICVWLVAAVIASLAAMRLCWSAVRAPA